MISILEACKIATENSGRPFVVGINEYKDGYAIVTSINDEIPDVGCIPFVRKDNGAVSSFFPPDHFGEKSKKIESPKRYRYNQ